jgi:hypothetical protein
MRGGIVPENESLGFESGFPYEVFEICIFTPVFKRAGRNGAMSQVNDWPPARPRKWLSRLNFPTTQDGTQNVSVCFRSGEIDTGSRSASGSRQRKRAASLWAKVKLA